MYLLVSKFDFLEFQLLLSRVAPYLQFVTTNCLITFPQDNVIALMIHMIKMNLWFMKQFVVCQCNF